jgi:hypothetical protein
MSKEQNQFEDQVKHGRRRHSPPALEYVFDEECVSVMVNGKEVFIFNDNWCMDCPEDLIWSREIGRIFELGVKIGYQLAGGANDE